MEEKGKSIQLVKREKKKSINQRKTYDGKKPYDL